MTKHFLSIVLLSSGVIEMLSAQTMSLSDCIHYAIDHNISVKQREINVENQEIMLENEKDTYLPSISANAGTGWSFGRTTSEDSNGYTQINSSSSNFGLNASMPLFTGLRTYNQIKSYRSTLEAAVANLESAKQDVSIQIAQYYLSALFNKGLCDIRQHQVELDSVAVENARTQYESGRKPASEVATAEAQLALSRHSLTEAKGNVIMGRLDLMQAMNLEGNVEEFDILDIDCSDINADIAPADLVLSHALECHPSILAAKSNLQSSRYDLKAAQSGYLPTVSLNASYGTSYQHMYGSFTDPMTNQKISYSSIQKSFGRQLSDHANKYIGFSVNIPIFDRFQTRNSKRRANLQIENQQLALSNAQQSLNKDIQQAYWNAVKARDNYLSAQKAAASTDLAYHYESERYNAGKGTAYSLQQARTKLESAMNDELRSKYELLMRIKILDYYNGISIE